MRTSNLVTHRRTVRGTAGVGSHGALRPGLHRLRFETLEHRLLLDGVPLITEFMADNVSTLYSLPLDDYPDWIELYNPGPGSVDLKDWYLTDRKSELHRWQFPEHRLLAEDEFLVVLASGIGTIEPGGQLHTNFKLGVNGEYLALTRPDGTTVVSEYDPAYPPQSPDVSYGLTTSLDDEAYFTTPTPGEVNPPLFKKSVFSIPHGFFVEPIQVALDTVTLAEPIYYTTDGTVPTPADQLYDGLIVVNTTTTMRVRAFGLGATPTVYTQTYIFLDDVLSQPADPDGFPVTWEAADGSSVVADYEMDADVVTDPRYGGSLVEDFLVIPAVSIAMDPDDLFSVETGIYANPLSRGQDWERAASIELIYPDGSEGFQVDAGIRVRGGDSRVPANSPKHSFRVKFSSDYGTSRFEFPLFPGSDVEEFDNLLLRGGYQDTWLSPDPDDRHGATLLRDRWARETHLAMGQPASRGLFVHLYVDGLYWGVYELSERIDDAYGAIHFGGNEPDYDVIDSGELTDGTIDAWNALIDMATAGVQSDQSYAAIQQYLNVPSFIDFMILNVFAGRIDLADGNWYAMRNRATNEPFRFFSWDAERTLRATDEDQSAVTGTNSPAYLYGKLRENAEFRRAFGDRVQRHFANGGPLTTEATADRWTQLAAVLGDAVVVESARWGDYRRDVHPFSGGPYELHTLDDHWIVESQRLAGEYMAQRTDIVIDQFLAAGLFSPVEAPTLSQPGGSIDPQSSLILTAPQGAIYYTTDGADPWRFGEGVDPSASLYAGPVPLTGDMVIKARTLLDDGRWSALAEATFYRPMPLVITELMYHALPDEDLNSPFFSGDFDFVELMNVGSEPLDLSDVAFTRGIAFRFVFSAVHSLEPGERVVVVANSAAFSTRHDTAGMLIAGSFSGRLNNTGERITLSGSLGHVIADFTYSDDWFPITDDEGFSLVPRLLCEDPTDRGDPAIWRPSHYVGGSPGTADLGYNPGSILITETLTHNDGFPGDWIELYNTTDEDFDLGGWYLSDSSRDLIMYQIAAGTILPAGGYLVFSAEEHFKQEGQPGVNTPFSINKLGDSLHLTSAAADGSLGGYREAISFGYGFNPVSFIRHTNSMGEIEYVPSSGNTPGEPNLPPLVGMTNDHGTTYLSPVINEVMYHPAGDGDEYVELHNPHPSEAKLFGPFQDEDTWRLTDGVYYNFPPGVTVPGYGYVLVVGIDPDEFRVKYDVPAETQIFGPFAGDLLNTGDRLVLSRPVPRASFVPYSMADQVRYNVLGDWPMEADGYGPSLNRRSPAHYGNDVLNWTLGIPGGTPGRPNVDASPPTVVDRHVFYNHSAFDDNDPVPDADDDGAVAVDKRALRPGEIATFDHYTSYGRGINGLMIDLAGLPVGVALGVADFEFHVGNDDNPDAWPVAPAPSEITFRAGAGTDYSDRVTIVWPDGAIRNQWLEVTVLSTAHCPLPTADVFYFGNAVAEAGDMDTNARITVADLLLARNNPRDLLSPTGVDFSYDYNRDTYVNATDVLLARNNRTSFLDTLQLIDLSGEAEEAQGPPLANLAWLTDLDQSATQRPAEKDGAAEAVDLLLASLWS
ncbi:MAG: lamin tail domain-containing protein [Candidatus Nealsonbacteria bacterium]|nr:lamin tail domain-containing protein [Candidatus Nealsonbacteria bacterium]